MLPFSSSDKSGTLPLLGVAVAFVVVSFLPEILMVPVEQDLALTFEEKTALDKVRNATGAGMRPE